MIEWPRDLTGLREFRDFKARLKGVVGGSLATMTNGSGSWMELPDVLSLLAEGLLKRFFVVLAYSVTPNNVGGMGDGDYQMLEESVGAWVAKALVESGWLVRAASGGYVCELFRLWNGSLDPALVSNAQKGGRARAWKYEQGRIRADARELVLLPDELWRFEDGKPMGSELIAQIQWLVRSFDKVTKRSVRQTIPGDWPPDLVCLAAHVLELHGQEKLTQLLRRLWMDGLKDRALVPRTTHGCLVGVDALLAVAGIS